MALKQKGHFRVVSILWWIFTAIMGLAGLAFALIGVLFEAATKGSLGIYIVVISPFLLAASGIFAIVATKFESEEH